LHVRRNILMTVTVLPLALASAAPARVQEESAASAKKANVTYRRISLRLAQ
jgi:hypothetical protein